MIQEAEPQIVLSDGVVIDGAIITAARPCSRETLRYPHRVTDLPRRHPAICHPHGLVMQETVHVALRLQVGDDALVAPGRPVVEGEHHLHVVPEHVERLLQVFRPQQAIAHFRAAQRVEIVQGVGRVFGRAEGFVFWEIDMNSDGASDSGAMMICNSTPSTVMLCPVSVVWSVGRIRLVVPVEVVLPKPPSTCPAIPLGRRLPYM